MITRFGLSDALASKISEKLTQRLGGPGSGHHGHAGRPGKRGGSAKTKVAVSAAKASGGFKLKPSLIPLARTSLHYDTFEDFERDYTTNNFHGTYVHLTNDADFRVDPNRAPRDASSMSIGSSSYPGLMVTTDPENWDFVLSGKGTVSPKDAAKFRRKYMAIIDLSYLVPGKDYISVARGFGHEIFVRDNLDKVKVLKVVPIDRGIRQWNYRYNRVMPNSSRDLRDIYNWARENKDRLLLDKIKSKEER